MKLGIFGASGHAKEILDIALDIGYTKIVFINTDTKEKHCMGFPVIGEDEIYLLKKDEYEFAIGVGDNHIRENIFHRFETLNFPNIVHPAATFGYGQSKEIRSALGNVVAAGARISCDVHIGNFGIYNHNCTIGHDCIIEDFVHIAPGANVSGYVNLSAGSFIGTNASILPGSENDRIVIGKNATVGAGSVVTKSVPANAVVKGIPAK